MGEPLVKIALAVVVSRRSGRVFLLITRRPPGVPLPGLWEFTGGKVKSVEALQDCVVREVSEETGLRVVVDKPLPVIRHAYPHATVALHPFLCHLAEGQDPAAACLRTVEHRWVPPAELRRFEFPAANASLVRLLETMFEAQG